MTIKTSLLDIEILRYKRKGGQNIIIALCLFPLLFYTLYSVGKIVWPAKIQHPKTFLFISTCVVHTVSALVLLICYLPAYYLGWPALEKYRINKDQTWHWQRPTWKEYLQSKTIKQLAIIHFFYFPLFVGLSVFRTKMSFDFPDPKSFMTAIALTLVCEDFTFYWTHRLLHHPILYKYIHKIHHQYDAPFSNSSQYAHPAEYVLGNMLPAAIGILLLGEHAHVYSYLCMILIRMMNTFEVHSGLEFGWSPMRIVPFTSIGCMHYFHHSKNAGTYGSYFYLLDHFNGTNQQFYKSIFKLQ